MKFPIVLLSALVVLASCSEQPQESTNTPIEHVEEQKQLDTAIHVVEELKKEPLVLAENDLGELKLEKDTETNRSELAKIFAGYQIEQTTGYQDGPDFIYYHIKQNDTIIASIKMMDENDARIDKIYIEDSTLKDEYGISIGDTYAEVKHKRPGLETVIGDHFVFYVTEVGSPIGYEIWGNTDSVSISMDNYWETELVESEIADWKVTRLYWFNPDF